MTVMGSILGIVDPLRLVVTGIVYEPLVQAVIEVDQ
jgi:hypothetical protein